MLDAKQRGAFAEVMQPPAIAWLRANIETPDLVDAAIAAVADAQ
jgi:hypothetical protein